MRNELLKLINLNLDKLEKNISFVVIEEIKCDGYIRQKIEYSSNGMKVPAFLLIPDNANNAPAVIISHQHNGERHLGKSEVVGLEGNPLQAFGVMLVKKGFVVLAPDTISFEDRRRTISGTKSLENDLDFWHHLLDMSYGILNGEPLMKREMIDAMNGVTLLSDLPYVDNNKIGALGHSMGGNTTQFLAAIDERIKYSCASGSACTYENRMKNGVGIELGSVIPNFNINHDIDDLYKCIAPRRVLIVSAKEDKYSKDATFIYESALKEFEKYNAKDNITHIQYEGGHPLTQERVDAIINWFCDMKF